MAQLVEGLTLDFSSGCDPRVVGSGCACSLLKILSALGRLGGSVG